MKAVRDTDTKAVRLRPIHGNHGIIDLSAGKTAQASFPMNK